LAASDIYHGHFKFSSFSKKKAGDILSLIGQFGLLSISSFSDQTHNVRPGGPPLGVWLELLRNFSKNPAVQAGAFLNFLVVTEIDPESRTMKRGKKDELRRGDVVSQILVETKDKNPIFKQIEKSIDEGKLFPRLKQELDLL
jgi:hypothetical protein